MFLKNNQILSIIIPAFNEEDRIGDTLDAVFTFIKKQPYQTEIIVVNDGSRDATERVLKEKQRTHQQLRYILLDKNYGKGKAVREGMGHARGDVCLFMDADNSTSIDHVTPMLEEFARDADVVVGSRKLRKSHIHTKQHYVREMLGWLFRVLSHVILPVSVWDTQNGFKAFTKDAAKMLFQKQKTNGWAFDVELLWLAKKSGLKVSEIPVTWVNDERSKVTLGAMVRMLFDLLKIRIRGIL